MVKTADSHVGRAKRKEKVKKKPTSGQPIHFGGNPPMLGLGLIMDPGKTGLDLTGDRRHDLEPLVRDGRVLAPYMQI